ncbi:MAG: DUF1566 domain-containing protein [Candidatus Scalindua sp.]|nr:DUF1566 domain-containing protein [Candidatus Scalindua sp.]
MSQAQSIPHISIHENTDWGFYGHSTIQNNYELKTIKNGKVVVDHATELMLFQSGTVKYLNYEKPMQLLEEINKEGYAGYNDWRLPALEEAVSLLEPDKQNGLFVDPVFDKGQSSIWTSDHYNPEITWRVAFDSGSVSWGYYGNYGGSYIRPVCPIK